MNSISKDIVPVLKKYGVKKAALFGSYARGTADDASDVDILIEPPEGMGIAIVRLKRDLEENLQKKVDLISYNGIHKYLRESILANQVDLL